MLIDIRNLTKDYQMDGHGVAALRGIDLQVDRGEFVAIMGPSGSGKSTLMNILGCLDNPTSGSYHFEGTDVTALDDDQLSEIRNRHIGFIFQSFNLLKRMNALENVELPLMYAGIDRQQRIALARQALVKVGLEDRMTHRPSELSGGQRQRVAIARALVNNPGIILADEPTGALDTVSGMEIMDVFKQLHAEGNTILVITHERDIADCCRRIIHIRDGQITSDIAN